MVLFYTKAGHVIEIKPRKANYLYHCWNSIYINDQQDKQQIMDKISHLYKDVELVELTNMKDRKTHPSNQVIRDDAPKTDN